MAIAVQSDVRSTLHEFEPILLGIVRSAWDDDWGNSPHRAQIRYRRTRANLVHDFIIHRAVAAFDENKDVHVVHQDETAKFLFKQKVLLRFKKGDANSLGANITTQAVLAFTDPQMMMPGLPDVQKVDVVYVLNDFETSIDRVSVTARDNEVRLWSYDIEDNRGSLILPLPQPIQPVEGDKVVRLRPQANVLQLQGKDKK